MENLSEVQTNIQEQQLVSPSQKNWRKIRFLVTTALFLTTAGVFGFYVSKARKVEKTPQPTSVPILTPIPTPTPKLPVISPTPTLDPTADWKTYRNEEYGYTIRYPNSWQVEENVNYIGPDSPNYTFFFKEKVEFMPGVSVYIVSPTTPEKWLGTEILKFAAKEKIIIDETQGTRILNIPGPEEQEWVFLDKSSQTFIFYASGWKKEELAIFHLMLSTFKFLE